MPSRMWSDKTGPLDHRCGYGGQGKTGGTLCVSQGFLLIFGILPRRKRGRMPFLENLVRASIVLAGIALGREDNRRMFVIAARVR